jgi:hypothetical protein
MARVQLWPLPWQGPPCRAARSACTVPRRGIPATVLLVEDDPAIAKTIALALEEKTGPSVAGRTSAKQRTKQGDGREQVEFAHAEHLSRSRPSGNPDTRPPP